MSLQAIRSVVNARMYDLAVTRARLCTDSAMALDEQRRRVIALSELPGNGKADNAATDNLILR